MIILLFQQDAAVNLIKNAGDPIVLVVQSLLRVSFRFFQENFFEINAAHVILMPSAIGL